MQCVTLPRHHQDQPGEQPKCKGFALVTLSSSSHLETLLTRWPWNRNVDTTTMDVESETSREARRFGFRTISKSQWNKLNEEYLSYKQSLLQEIAQEDEEYGPYGSQEDRGRQKRPATPSDDEFQPEDGPPGKAVTTLSSPYPLGCLLFVRNVHPETNKTTLKTLFSATLNTSETGVEGIDYVDFNKGMDSVCLFHPGDLYSMSDGFDSVTSELLPRTTQEYLSNTSLPHAPCKRAVLTAQAQNQNRATAVGKLSPSNWSKEPEKSSIGERFLRRFVERR